MPTPFGTDVWGQSPTPFTQLPGCDVANCVNDVWFRLGFLNADDMGVDDRWVTLAELYQFGDDATKVLARSSGLFLVYDASIVVVAGTAAYALPTGHILTVIAWLPGFAFQWLRLSTVGQLFALDANWPTTTGDPVRLSLDAGGVGTATLYPSPISDSVLNQVMQQIPADVVSGTSSIPASPILQDYLTYALLAGARGKESDSAMPEMAAHFRERMNLYEQVIGHLWGAGR